MARPHDKNLGEQPMTRLGRIQGPEKRFRRLRFPSFPSAVWAEKNPLLQRGEIGAETDTQKWKIGDGVTYWNDLPYTITESRWGDINGDIQAQQDLINALNDKASVDALAQEKTAREQADAAIQKEISTLEAASDVADVVGTYADLLAYDTSKLTDNAIIKVLNDETQGGASTYYRWTIGG